MTGRENIFKAHWEWFVALAGIGVLGAAIWFYLPTLTESADDVASGCDAQIRNARPAHEGVKPADMSMLYAAMRSVRTPPALAEVDAKKASFLASERRIFCKAADGAGGKSCGRPIPAESATCPFCGVSQPAIVKVEIDSDHDGMPNDWEIKYGLNADDPRDAAADKDGDGFTNLEEYEAKTDPTDPKSHPDYLDFVRVQGTLKQTFLPFYFKQANPIGGNTYRLTFQRLDVKGVYDRMLLAKVGDPIKSSDGKFDTGYVSRNYSIKEVEVPAYKGSEMMKKVKVGFADIERVKDGKKLTLREGTTRIPVETQVDIVYEREGGKTFTVFTGAEFDIHGVKYLIKKLGVKDGKPVVTIEEAETKKQKIVHGT